MFRRLSLYHIHFNPRSHEGSDCKGSPSTASARISIHAPTRGATIRLIGQQEAQQFQSTLPRGERLHHLEVCSLQHLISIHAPTRGATNWTPSLILSMKYFNPRSHEGSDVLHLLHLLSQNNFNPRSHEGSDIFGISFPSFSQLFQSTLPRGERRNNACPVQSQHIFQSTLPRGERR